MTFGHSQALSGSWGSPVEGQELDFDDLCESLPTQDTLWFYNLGLLTNSSVLFTMLILQAIAAVESSATGSSAVMV